MKMEKISFTTGLILSAVLLSGCQAEKIDIAAPGLDAATGNVIIVNANIIDGTGSPAYTGAVRISGDKIAAVGNLSPQPGETVVDAMGKVVAPGFIDTHSHLELIVDDDPLVTPAITQGITTVVVGQDGFSPYPLQEWYQKLEVQGVGPNVASYAGHNTLRALVLTDDAQRPATVLEIDRISVLLAQEMGSGALGLSTGLEYDSGIYSDSREIISLVETAKNGGGRYITHIRSEDRDFWPALEEAIEVGRETGIPVQISHIKLSMKSLWGQAEKVLERLQAARAEGIDVTADIYPYSYWKSTMTVLLPERNLQDRAALEYAFREIAPPEKIVVTLYQPDAALVGKSIADIARERSQDPVTTYLELLQQSDALAAERGVIRQEIAGIVAHAMSEEDIETFVGWEHTNICSDGEKDAHPRAYGAYPRVLARYVRDRSALTVEQAVRKMSALAAAHMGIADRGLLVPGMYADLVLFDPDLIQDHASIENPGALSTGIDRVWVNGDLVIVDGAPSSALPGRVLRRSAVNRVNAASVDTLQ